MAENSPEKFYPRDQAEGLRRLVASMPAEARAEDKNHPLPESLEAQKIRERLKKIHKN